MKNDGKRVKNGEKASAIFELLEFEDVAQLVEGCKIVRIILSIYEIKLLGSGVVERSIKPFAPRITDFSLVFPRFSLFRHRFSPKYFSLFPGPLI